MAKRRVGVVSEKIEQQRIVQHFGRRPKYGNRKTVVAGLTFDSAWEAEYWGTLRLLEMAGEIQELARQVRIPIWVNGVKVATFIADFTYEERTPQGWSAVVADCKSAHTRTEPYYRLKKRLLKAAHHIDIREVLRERRRGA